MAHSYQKGQGVKCTAEFKDGDTGAYVDPTTVTFRTLNPNNVASAHVYGVDVNVIKDSVGHYHYIVTGNVAGTWYYRWDCTGTYTGASQRRFTICDPAWPLW